MLVTVDWALLPSHAMKVNEESHVPPPAHEFAKPLK